MTDTVTVTLSKPIEHKGHIYSELTFREATAGDLATADAVTGDMTKTLTILACMATVELAVIKNVRACDLAPMIEKVAPLMGEQEARAGQTS